MPEKRRVAETAPRTASIGAMDDFECVDTALDLWFAGREVADTIAAAEPIVGLGTGPLEPFSATAVEESWANPMESGW